MMPLTESTSRGARAAPWTHQPWQTSSSILTTVVCAPLVIVTRMGFHRALLAVALLDIPLQIDQNFSYRAEPAQLGALGGFNISLTTLALVGLYLSWLLMVTARVGDRPRLHLRGSAALLTYVGLTAISALVAYDRGLATREMFLLSQMLLLYCYVLAFVRSRRDAYFVLALLVLGLLVEGCIILGLSGGASLGRASGTVGAANVTGAYLSLLLAPTLAILLTPLASVYKAVASLAFLVGTAALALTQSRSAWIAFVLSVGVFCVSAWRRGLMGVRVPLIMVAGTLVVAVAFHETIITRLTGDDNGAAQGRIPLMRTAMKMIGDHPILGVGPNNYAATLPEYGAISGYWGDWIYTVHNKYLLVWAEAGTGAVVAFVWFLCAVLRRMWGVWRHGDAVLSLIALGCAGAVFGHMAHMMSEIFNANQRAPMQLLWVLAAIMMAVSRHQPQMTAEAAKP